MINPFDHRVDHPTTVTTKPTSSKRRKLRKLPRLSQSNSAPHLSLKVIQPKWFPSQSLLSQTDDQNPMDEQEQAIIDALRGKSRNASVLHSLFDEIAPTTTNPTTTGFSPSSKSNRLNLHPIAPAPVKSSSLTAFIISCHGIVAADANGKSDPFVEIEFAGQKQCTRVQEDVTNPTFDELIDFVPPSVGKKKSDRFTIRVYDHDDFGEPDLLGTVVIPFHTFHSNHTPATNKFLFPNDNRRFVSHEYPLELPPEFVLSSTKLESTISLVWTLEETTATTTTTSPVSKTTTTTTTTRATTAATATTATTATTNKDRKTSSVPSLTPLCSGSTAQLHHILRAHYNYRSVQLADAMHQTESWVDLLATHFPNNKDLLAQDHALLTEMNRSTYVLINILIAAELRLRKRGIYPSVKDFPDINVLIQMLDEGMAVEKTTETFVSFLLDQGFRRWTAMDSDAETNLSATTAVLGIFSALPFDAFVSKEQLLHMLSTSNVTEESLDCSMFYLHGILCQNAKNEYSLNNGLFHKVIKQKLHVSYAPSINIILTSGIAKEVARLTRPAWFDDNDTGTIKKKATEPPLALAFGMCHTTGVAFCTHIPRNWHVGNTSNVSTFYTTLIHIIATSTCAAQSEALKPSPPSVLPCAAPSSLLLLRQAHQLLLTLRAKMCKHLGKPTLVRVSLLSAAHLPVMDAVLRSSDPYAVISMDNQDLYTTTAKPRTLRPKWEAGTADEAVICVTSWKETNKIQFLLFDRDSSFGESEYTAAEDTEDDEIGRVTFVIASTLDGTYTTPLMLPPDVQPSSTTEPPVLTYSIHRIDLFPTLTLLEHRLTKSINHLEVTYGVDQGSDVDEDHSVDQLKRKIGEQEQEKMVVRMNRLETVDAARARLTELSTRPATTLQDLCSIVCMLDNQTLADLSAIFTDNVRSSIATKETTDKQAVANDLIDTKTETKIKTETKTETETKTMSKEDALVLVSPKRTSNSKDGKDGGGTAAVSSSTQRGRAKSQAFRQGIITALLKCGFKEPEKEAMDSLIESLDMEQRGYVQFSALSGILIGSNDDNATEANTSYRGVKLVNTYVCPATTVGGTAIASPVKKRKKKKKKTLLPLEATKIKGYPDDAISTMCVMQPAAKTNTSDSEENNGSSGSIGGSIGDSNNNMKGNDSLRLCTVTPMGKCISVIDVNGSPGGEMKCELVSNVSMHTPDRIMTCCTCGDTGLVAVSTEGNDLIFFLGNSNWDPSTSRKKNPEKFLIRYKITNLSYSPALIHFYSGALPTPSMKSGMSTRKKDLFIFAGEKGEISMFVATIGFRNDAIKFTKATERWPPAFRTLLQEDIHCTIVSDKTSGISVTGQAERTTITSMSKVNHLAISEINSWNAIQVHDQRITMVKYNSHLKSIVTASEDGTVKIIEIVYHGTALKSNESIQFGNIRTFDGHEGKVVNGFIFDEDHTIYSFGRSREILQWDASNFKVLRKFYIGSSVRDAQILNGVSSQHLIALTVPRIVSADNDTMQLQWVRVFDIIGGNELQNFSKEYSSYIRSGGRSDNKKAGSFSSAPHRETTSILVRGSTVHNGFVVTGSRGGVSVFAVPPVWAPIGSIAFDGSLVPPPASGQVVAAIVTHIHTRLITVLISALFDFILTVDEDGLVRSWDMNTGIHVHAWTISKPPTTASMDQSGQHMLIGFSDATLHIVHVFSGEVLVVLTPPPPLGHFKSNGEIVAIRHSKLKGGKESIVGATSTGTIISWNLGSGIEGTSGIIIGLVNLNSMKRTSALVHHSMIVNMTLQSECQASHHNLLGVSTLDGRILVLSADRVGKALINQQVLNNAICTTLVFSNHVLFCGHNNGMLSCHSIASDGLKLFETTVVLNLKTVLAHQTQGSVACNAIQEAAPTSLQHLTLASGGRLLCTIGQAVRVWDITQLPTDELPTKDANWLDMLKPLISFFVPELDSEEVEAFIFDDDEGKNSGLLYIGGKRIVQVWTVEGACLGQFGDQYTWLVDDKSTWRSQIPEELMDVKIDVKVWAVKRKKTGVFQRKSGTSSLPLIEDTTGGTKKQQKDESASTEEKSMYNPRRLKPERSKDLTWNLELRKNRRLVHRFDVDSVTDTSSKVKAGTKRRSHEAKEWARKAFGKRKVM